jgi:gamma-glutamyl:cysteine ligase YbdK (ATP-grasp superfamily)
VTDVPATLAAITALIVAVGAFVLNFLKERASERAEKAAARAVVAAEAAKAAAESNDAKLIEIDGKISTLGKAVDGRLTALIKSLEENANIRVTAAKASGKLEGKAEAVAEASDKAAAADDGGRRNGVAA